MKGLKPTKKQSGMGSVRGGSRHRLGHGMGGVYSNLKTVSYARVQKGRKKEYGHRKNHGHLSQDYDLFS